VSNTRVLLTVVLVSAWIVLTSVGVPGPGATRSILQVILGLFVVWQATHSDEKADHLLADTRFRVRSKMGDVLMGLSGILLVVSACASTLTGALKGL